MDWKAQDQNAHIAGRIKDLSSRTEQADYLTHTNFLSASELSECRKLMKSGLAGGTAWCQYGGYPEAERAVVCFLPTWMAGPEEADEDIVCCIRIRPVNARFSDHPGHRDYLGALMNLGIERDQLGDILIQKDTDEAFVFALPGIADYICRELTSVRHTSVGCEKVPCSECTARPEFKEVTGSVASQRLDAVMSMVLHLSRTRTRELIEEKLVSVNGDDSINAGLDLKEGDRVSVRGHGKFVFDQVLKQTKKERLFISVRVYN